MYGLFKILMIFLLVPKIIVKTIALYCFEIYKNIIYIILRSTSKNVCLCVHVCALIS